MCSRWKQKVRFEMSKGMLTFVQKLYNLGQMILSVRPALLVQSVSYTVPAGSAGWLPD